MAQLPESDFEVDPGLRDIIEAQIKQEEEAVCQVLLHIVWRPSKNSRVAVQLHHRQLKHLRPIAFRSDIASCQPACVHMRAKLTMLQIFVAMDDFQDAAAVLL